MILEPKYNTSYTEDSIREHLTKEFPDEMWVFRKIKQDSNIPSVFYITIKGDWKHHHDYTDKVMRDYGLVKIGEKSIWQSLNDCYKSTHIYASTL